MKEVACTLSSSIGLIKITAVQWKRPWSLVSCGFHW